MDRVLTIGGSDSGGAAGVQADLKTFTALGVYGMSALTVVTAQNSEVVAGVEWLPAGFITDQITTVLSDYGADAIKTGFIGQAEAIIAIANALPPDIPLVVDPVLVNHRGASMFGADVTQAYLEHLIPRATLITPNRLEAALLAGREIESLDGMVKAAMQLQAQGANSVLVKGWREGDDIIDVWCDPGRDTHLLTSPHITTKNTHGSGDTLSAAIATYLAKGEKLGNAIHQARQFTHRAIKNAAHWQLGKGHGPLNHMS